jgi:NAD(P)-dependent dehydrogenase (short-subunit alcohol dehydrogenase family)
MKKLLLISFLLSSTIISYAKEMTTVFITGANRGIGLEFAKQYKTEGFNVIGTARNPDKAIELKALGVTVMQLDVTDPQSVKDLSKALKGQSIDILINNAGFFDRRDVSLDKVDFDVFERTLSINTLGPLRVTQALIENLQKGKKKMVINVSSGLGSISKSSGRWYAYRSSKSALNQINKILSVEFKDQGFTFTVIHPGWVRTDLGGPGATYSTEESVSKMMKLITKLTIGNTGKFYDLEGATVPW